MEKSDYVRMLQGVKPTMHKKQENNMPSVTDPAYAQSGRELLFNPKPYEMKQIYSNGVPLKEMQPFDAMYADRFQSFQQAKEFSETQHKDIKEKLAKIEEDKKKKQNPQPPQTE